MQYSVDRFKREDFDEIEPREELIETGTIKEEAKKLGIDITPDQLSKVEIYTDFLIDYNTHTTDHDFESFPTLSQISFRSLHSLEVYP